MPIIINLILETIPVSDVSESMYEEEPGAGCRDGSKIPPAVRTGHQDAGMLYYTILYYSTLYSIT